MPTHRFGPLAKVILLIFSTGCEQKPPSRDNVYKVLEYDAGKYRWTLLHFERNHSPVKLVITCNWSKLSDREPVAGPTECHLKVGDELIPNEQSDEAQYLFVCIRDKTLFITTGRGNDGLAQSFRIERADIIEMK